MTDLTALIARWRTVLEQDKNSGELGDYEELLDAVEAYQQENMEFWRDHELLNAWGQALRQNLAEQNARLRAALEHYRKNCEVCDGAGYTTTTRFAGDDLTRMMEYKALCVRCEKAREVLAVGP